MDKIFIHDLKIDTVIGILPHERKQKQPVVINLEFPVDIRQAAISENIADTIDYAAIVERIIAYVSQSQHKLLEALGENLVTLLRKEFHLQHFRLQLYKPQALPNANVGIIIER